MSWCTSWAQQTSRSVARDAHQCLMCPLVQTGIRIILTMVNFWHNMGGVEW